MLPQMLTLVPRHYAGRWGVKLVWVTTNMTKYGWVSIQVGNTGHWLVASLIFTGWAFASLIFFFLLQTKSCSSALQRLLHFFFFFCTHLALYSIGLLLLTINANQLFLRRISMNLKKVFNLTESWFPYLLSGGSNFYLDCLEAQLATRKNSLCLVGGKIWSVRELSPWMYINVRLRI